MSNFNWTDREERMCLEIYKKLEDNNFKRGLRSKLCREMSLKPNTPSFSSIMLKVGNYEYLFTNGARGLAGGARNPRTVRIYNKYKDFPIEETKEEVKEEVKEETKMSTFKWINREEYMCLEIYKKLEDNNFKRGLRSKLCREMSLKPNTPSFSSIMLKVGNYEYLFTNGNRGLAGGARNPRTVKIYNQYINGVRSIFRGVQRRRVIKFYNQFKEIKEDLKEIPFKWTDREELMCLEIYKKLIENNFKRSLRTKLCREMASKPRTPSFSSINLKVGNYEYLFTNGAKGMFGGAQNRRTIKIYNLFKDCSIEERKEELKESRFKWTDREELMCLEIYKKLIENNFKRGLRTKLCRKMASKPRTPSFSSINLKVGNYEYLFTNGAKGMFGGAQNRRTVKIYNLFKDCSIEEIEDEIIKLET